MYIEITLSVCFCPEDIYNVNPSALLLQLYLVWQCVVMGKSVSDIHRALDDHSSPTLHSLSTRYPTPLITQPHSLLTLHLLSTHHPLYFL